MKPVARKSEIFAENLPEEVILYDKALDRVHCLNKTAAAIWENSDGNKTVDDLVRVVEAKCGGSANRELVLQALEELEVAGLMETGNSVGSSAGLPSRREAVGKMVMAGSALIATIVAAAPAAHASPGVPSVPPKLPISHNPPDPPIGHHPRYPLPPTPPKRHKPLDPLPSHPMSGLNPAGPPPPDPLTGLSPVIPQPSHPISGPDLTNPQPPVLPAGLTRPQQKLDLLSYLIQPVRSARTHTLRVARAFWRTSG